MKVEPVEPPTLWRLVQSMRASLGQVPRVLGLSAPRGEDDDPTWIEIDATRARHLHDRTPAPQREAVADVWGRFDEVMALQAKTQAAAEALIDDLDRAVSDALRAASPDPDEARSALAAIADQLPPDALSSLVEIARGIAATAR